MVNTNLVMEQSSTNKQGLGMPFSELTHAGEEVINWEFETNSMIGLDAVESTPQGSIRVYYSPIGDDDTQGFHFCVVEVTRYCGSQDEVDDQLFCDEKTRVQTLVKGTANENGIRRTPPTDSGRHVHGLPVVEFQAVCELLNDLKLTHCGNITQKP
jgi:hypothetical protein